MKHSLILIPAILALTGCASAGEKATKIETVEVVKETQRPCPGDQPKRPAPLPTPLPDDYEQLAAVLAAKLVEYAGLGMYADKADAIMARCLDKPSGPP